MNYQNLNLVEKSLGIVASDPGTPAGVVAWANDLTEILTSPLVPVTPFQKGAQLPVGLGNQADEYALVRARRLELDKEAKAVKDRETEIYNCILSSLTETETGDTGAAGATHRVQLVMKNRYQPGEAGWPAIHAFIREHGMFELLQKRLADTAIKEYAEVNNGALPTGVEVAEVPSLSFNKV